MPAEPSIPQSAIRNPQSIRILAIGDIVGRPGRQIVQQKLPGLVREHKIDLVIANGENIAGGSGITRKSIPQVAKLRRRCRHAGRSHLQANGHRADAHRVRANHPSGKSLLAGGGTAIHCRDDGDGGVSVGVFSLLGPDLHEPARPTTPSPPPTECSMPCRITCASASAIFTPRRPARRVRWVIGWMAASR